LQKLRPALVSGKSMMENTYVLCRYTEAAEHREFALQGFCQRIGGGVYICDGILDGDSFMFLLRYDGLHPDTWRIACFKMLTRLASHINDKKSLSYYWREVAEQAGSIAMKYRKPPEKRLSGLNEQISIVKNGQEIGFSYEKLFSDLSLIGLNWDDIESIADRLTPIRPTNIQNSKERVSIEKIKECVLHYLEVCDLNKAEALYRKIHCNK
jgi:hypothetical protein